MRIKDNGILLILIFIFLNSGTMAYEAYKTEKGLISIRNANGLAISYGNKFNFTVEQINEMIKNYYGDNPVRYIQAKYEEKLAKEEEINNDF